MVIMKSLFLFLVAICIVNGVPVVFKESSPNGEAIVSISSSDPNVEKYFSQQFSTRSGFTKIDDTKDDREKTPGTVHSSISIAVPGKAIAGSARSFASASSGPFFPIFAFPEFGFNNFPDIKNWIRNVESFYSPQFSSNRQINTATAINDNGHVYGKVNSVTFDNQVNNKSSPKYENKVKSNSR